MTTVSTAIDLNADLGEGYGPWSMGDGAAILDVVTSANVACGGHAGDPTTTVKTLGLARHGMSSAAHTRATPTARGLDGASSR